MPKIKILKFTCSGSYEDYYQHLEDITDWEEVDYEDLNKLKKWVILKNDDATNRYYTNTQIVIIEDPKITVKKAISEYLDIAAEDIKEEEEKKKKQEMAAAKRKATILKKKKERELKKLEELKKKYGEK